MGASPLFYEEAATKIQKALIRVGNFISEAMPPARELIVFGCYFLITGLWLTAFGAHMTTQGDDWQMIASSHLGFYPACTGLQTWIVPYRPLHPFLHCIAYQVYGLDTTQYYALSALIYAGVAFMWHRVTRRLFHLPEWASVLAGIVWLAFPDDLARQHVIGGFRLLGPLLSLIGLEIILSATALRRVILGCVLTFIGFLIYENLIGLWLGLLIIYALISNGERLYRVRMALAAVFTVAMFTLWRTAIVPMTYTPATFVEGQHSFFNDWNYKLLQLKSTPYLPATNTIRNMYLTADVLPALSPADLNQMRVAATLCGIITLLALFYPSIGAFHLNRRSLIGIGLLALPLGAAPYYLTELDFTSEVFRSLNIPFGISLIALGVLFLLPRRGWKVIGAVIAICLTVYTTSAEALQAHGYENQRLCGVLEQLASFLPSFDGGMILVEGWQNTDAYQLSSIASAIWGSPGKTQWSLGVNGSHGYHLSGVEKVEIKGNMVYWEGLPPLALFKKTKFVFNPLPPETPVVVFRMEGERVRLVYANFTHSPDGIARERVKEMCR